MSKRNWICVSVVGSSYDEEVDVNSEPPVYRHRERGIGQPRHPGQEDRRVEREWIAGRRPDISRPGRCSSNDIMSDLVTGRR